MDNNSVLYLVDFGLAKPFTDRETGTHIPYAENRSACGTLTYISIHTQKVNIFHDAFA